MNRAGKRPEKRIVLFGGTFDPIHEGHLYLATQVLKRYPIEKLYFVPAKQNPLKAHCPGADAPHRLAMVELAIAETGDPRLQALDWEILRPGPSYGVLTLEALRKQHTEPLTLLMGNEVFQSLPEWREPERLVTLADVIVAVRERAGALHPREVLERMGIGDVQEDGRQPERTWHHQRAHWIDIIEISALAVSATQVRKALDEHRDEVRPPQGIQRAVWQYIKENQLYTVRHREA